jgi:uncharacterized membrane protein
LPRTSDGSVAAVAGDMTQIRFPFERTEMFQLFTVNWKTSVSGVALFISTLAMQIGYQFDADATTVADWNLVVATFIAMVGLLNARDNNKSSEDQTRAMKH